MPTRFIKECCRSSPSLQKLTDFQERLFWRLITAADDYGRFEADPCAVRSTCFPLGCKQTITDVSKCLQMFADLNMLVLYENSERKYGQLVNFIKHQGAPRATKSKHPAPILQHLQSYANICKQMHANALVSESESESESVSESVSESSSEIRISDSDLTLSCSNLNNLNGARVISPMEFQFNEFWKAYPKKQGKGLCWKWWRKQKPSGELFEKMLSTLKLFKQSEKWGEMNGKYVPMPSTWLNQGRWDDELSADHAIDRMREKFANITGGLHDD